MAGSLQADLQSAYEGLQGELQQLRARLDEQGEPPVPVAEVAAEPLRSQLAQPTFLYFVVLLMIIIFCISIFKPNQIVQNDA